MSQSNAKSNAGRDRKSYKPSHRKSVAKPRKVKSATPVSADPSEPLKGKQELFAKSVLSGLSLADAYRENYNAGTLKPGTIHVNASRMAAKIAPRIEWLKAQAASKTIASVIERKEILTRIARSVGNADPANYGHGAADGVWWAGFGNDDADGGKTASQNAEARGAIGGWRSSTTEDGSVIQDVKLRPYSDALGAIADLNKMEGVYAAEKHEHTVTVLDYARRRQ